MRDLKQNDSELSKAISGRHKQMITERECFLLAFKKVTLKVKRFR